MAYWYAETERNTAHHLEREDCDLIAVRQQTDRVSALIQCEWETAMDLRSKVGVIDVAPAEDGPYVDELTSITYVVRDNGTRCEPLVH